MIICHIKVTKCSSPCLLLLFPLPKPKILPSGLNIDTSSTYNRPKMIHFQLSLVKGIMYQLK